MTQQAEDTFELIVVDGKRKWLVNQVKILPYVAGGADEGEGEGEPKPKPGESPPKTFTQDELNAAINSRLTGARDKAKEDLLKEMGITDPAEAKALIAAAKEAEEKNQSELDKERKKAEKNESDAKSAMDELAAHKLTSAIVEQLVDHGGLTLAAAKRVRSMVTETKNDDEAIKASIDALKTDMPQLFTPAQGTGEPPNSNPGGAPPGGGGKPNDPQAQARRTLYERHPELKPKNAG